jgi:hypothetical protein
MFSLFFLSKEIFLMFKSLCKAISSLISGPKKKTFEPFVVEMSILSVDDNNKFSFDEKELTREDYQLDEYTRYVRNYIWKSETEHCYIVVVVACEEGFVPFWEDITALSKPLIKQHFNDEVTTCFDESFRLMSSQIKDRSLVKKQRDHYAWLMNNLASVALDADLRDEDYSNVRKRLAIIDSVCQKQNLPLLETFDFLTQVYEYKASERFVYATRDSFNQNEIELHYNAEYLYSMMYKLTSPTLEGVVDDINNLTAPFEANTFYATIGDPAIHDLLWLVLSNKKDDTIGTLYSEHFDHDFSLTKDYFTTFVAVVPFTEDDLRRAIGSTSLRFSSEDGVFVVNTTKNGLSTLKVADSSESDYDFNYSTPEEFALALQAIEELQMVMKALSLKSIRGV